jgi:hypothetical protein
MGQLDFSVRKNRWSGRQRRADRSAGPQLSSLLPQGVTAILLPHLKEALPAYAAKDRLLILAAYGVGAMLLSDLLSQNKDIPGWRDASLRALQGLAARSDVEALTEPGVADLAAEIADEIIAEFEQAPAYRLACQMLDAATQDMAERKTSAKGSVTLKAAMARLESLALNAKFRPTLAA